MHIIEVSYAHHTEVSYFLFLLIYLISQIIKLFIIFSHQLTFTMILLILILNIILIDTSYYKIIA